MRLFGRRRDESVEAPKGAPPDTPAPFLERVARLADEERALVFAHMRSMYRIRRNTPSMFDPRRRRRFERHGQAANRILERAEKVA